MECMPECLKPIQFVVLDTYSLTFVMLFNTRPDTVFRHLRPDRGVGATPPPLVFPNEAS